MHLAARKELSQVKEYDLFIPLSYNDGSPVESRKFQALQKRLLAEFGGLTFFPQPNLGFWSMGGVTYRDEIVIYRVVTRKAHSARRFLKRLKEELKKALRQEEIFIAERDIEVL
jgi:hypothetical protein